MKQFYQMQRSEKFDSKVFNPPSIVQQLKQRSMYQNDPTKLVSQSVSGSVKGQPSRFKEAKLMVIESPIKVLESNKKNR
jgi:hypothetical protein